MLNIGTEIEDFVGDLVSGSFFADFTIRSPKYTKSNQEKEAVDILVLFEDTLIGIQVKSKWVDLADGEMTEVENNRVAKTITKATAQFRALKDALQRESFKEFTNGRGFPMPFDRSKISKVHLIVVAAFIPRDPAEEPPRLIFQHPPGEYHELLHFFDLLTFQNLLQILDTLPDFVNYLDTSGALRTAGLVPTSASPADVWAKMTFEKESLANRLKREPQPSVGDSGSAEPPTHVVADPLGLTRCAERYIEDTERLEAEEQEGYLIDQFIEHLHETIGSGDYPQTLLEKIPNQIAPPGSVEAYQRMIPFLARLNRFQRTELAKQILIRLERIRDGEPLTFGGVQFDDRSVAYVFSASKGFTRHQRLAAAIKLSRAIGSRYAAEWVIGLSLGVTVSGDFSIESVVADLRGDVLEPELVEWADKYVGDRYWRDAEAAKPSPQ